MSAERPEDAARIVTISLPLWQWSHVMAMAEKGKCDVLAEGLPLESWGAVCVEFSVAMFILAARDLIREPIFDPPSGFFESMIRGVNDRNAKKEKEEKVDDEDAEEVGRG